MRHRWSATTRWPLFSTCCDIGARAFDEGLRVFWAKHRGANAGWSELQAAFEEAAGRRLDTFFTQWLQRRDAPSLRLIEAAATQDTGRWRVTIRVAQEAPSYRLTVPIAIESAAGRQMFRLTLDGTEATGSFLLMERPTAVTIDPDFDLFRSLTAAEAPPRLRDVTLSGETGIVIPSEGIAAETAQALAARLLDAGGKRIPATAAVTHAGPLLIVGTEEQVAPFLESLGVTGPAAPPGSARAWVARRDDRAIMVVTAIDAEALAALMRPLPHYGGESWVVFDGAKVVDKGIWPAGDNPLRRRL